MFQPLKARVSRMGDKVVPKLGDAPPSPPEVCSSSALPQRSAIRCAQLPRVGLANAVEKVRIVKAFCLYFISDVSSALYLR